MSEASELLSLNAAEFTDAALGERLRSVAAESTVEVAVSSRLNGFGAGLELGFSLKVTGDLGDFALLMCEHVDVDVRGNVGHACGHSLSSGSVLVRGSAGNCLAAFATGGFLAVHASAGDRCGFRLAGADVFVRSSVGRDAGFGMTAGTLVLGNGAGEGVGHEMTGGLIYIRGDVKSVSEHARQVRMKDAESLRLSLFLARAGIKGKPDDFKVYRARREGKS